MKSGCTVLGFKVFLSLILILSVGAQSKTAIHLEVFFGRGEKWGKGVSKKWFVESFCLEKIKTYVFNTFVQMDLSTELWILIVACVY